MLSQKDLSRSIWPFRLQLINFRSDFDKSIETQETVISLTEVIPKDEDSTQAEAEGAGGSSDNMNIQNDPRRREGLSGDEAASSEHDLLLPSGDSSVLVRSSKRSRGFLVVLTFFAALGGFLFGYDTGVVSGAMIKVREDFSLSSTLQEAVVSVTVGAAALAAAVGGPTSDLIGRKPTLLIASVVFTVGAIVMGVAWLAWILLIGRVVVGVGIGFAAMAVPMYIAEMAPAKMRGSMVVVNNLGITGGQFVATLIDGVFSYLPVNIGWRFMFALAGVPSILMFVGFIFMPESPRWLVFHGQTEKARRVLYKVRPAEEVEPELEDIVKDYEELQLSNTGCLELGRRFCTSRTVLLALFVGCGLQLFQQFGGINTVMYYSASIIQMAGFSDRDAIWLATIPAFANFAFTIVGLLLVERIGRRKLLIGSVTGTIFGFCLLSATFVVMDHYSPAAVSLHSGGLCNFDSCGACVGNSQCGFCVDRNTLSGEYFNGTCSRGGIYSNGTTYSSFTTNHNGTALCAVYGDLTRNSTSAGEIVGELVPFSGSGDLIPLQGAYHREWDFTNCPNNIFAPITIVALFVYIAFFAPGMGPLPWTINSEIFPTWARSTGIAISTFVNWSSNLVVSMTFLTLADNLGQPKTFGIYAALGFLGLLFFVFFVPETKGKNLEEVEGLFKQPYFCRWCPRIKKRCGVL